MAETKVTSYETRDWTDLTTAPNTVTANGNRSYSLVFNSTNYIGLIQPGTRIRTTRTVAAPTQCTSLNGTNQYFNKTSPAGMTFTNNFVVSAWVKLTSYAATDMTIASRYNGTSGWALYLQASTGQINLAGWNASSANYSVVQSYQSVPLNKWVHIAAQLDMATFTATPTTSYVMIDGLDVPALVSRAGTNPTALVQAGNLEIGSQNGGLKLFPGKLAQVAIYSAKVTQANVLASISQKLLGTETSLISAFSFDGNANDLNTTNANNLTAQNSAVATNADSPFGGQSFGTISSTLDYGIVQSATFSTNTTLVVQVPVGCTIPTTGGVSTISYSGLKAPYGMPIGTERYKVEYINLIQVLQNTPAANTWYNPNNQMVLNVPVGEWLLEASANVYGSRASGTLELRYTISGITAAEDSRLYTDVGQASPTTDSSASLKPKRELYLSAATKYYSNILSSTALNAIFTLGDRQATIIVANLRNV